MSNKTQRKIINKICNNKDCDKKGELQFGKNFGRTIKTQDGRKSICKKCEIKIKNQAIEIGMKICCRTDCIYYGEFQSKENFCKTKNRPDGYYPVCKTCRKSDRKGGESDDKKLKRKTDWLKRAYNLSQEDIEKFSQTWRNARYVGLEIIYKLIIVT